MKLINDQPVQKVETRIVSCDGGIEFKSVNWIGGGALGHPKVYINLDTLEPRACGKALFSLFIVLCERWLEWC